MSQTALSNLEKAAVLLRSLPSNSSEQVLELLEPAEAARLRSAITSVAKRSDFVQSGQPVMQEFLELYRRGPADGAAVTSPPNHLGNRFARQYSETAKLMVNEQPSTGMVAQDDQANREADLAPELTLAAVAAPVLAQMLHSEPVRVLALVLKELSSDQAAGVLKLLPLESRAAALTLMASGTSFNPLVVERVVQTLLSQCAKPGFGGLKPKLADECPARMLANILQTVEREERMQLIEQLGQQDPEMATKIDHFLYDYADLLRIEDRSVQKLLTQVGQKTLAMALKTAPETIKDKVTKNMSERVRLALTEEMELIGTVAKAKVETAREELTAVIRTQDKNGMLVWLE